MLRTRTVDDERGRGDLLRHTRIQDEPRLSPAQHLSGIGAAGLNPVDFVGGEGTVDQEDVADAVWTCGIDDGFFRGQQTLVAVEGDEKGVCPVGDVLDEARRQADERAVFVHSDVEVTPGEQEPAGKHQVSQAAVVECERPAGRFDFLREALQPQSDRRAWRRGNRLEQPERREWRTRLPRTSRRAPL